MSDLKTIAQIAYDRLFPNANAQTPQKIEHFIEKAKIELAYQMWLISKQEKAADGEWEVPSTLLRIADLDIVDGQADLSGVAIFRSLQNGTWIQSIGGNGCNYQRRSANLNQILTDDDYDGNDKPYFEISDKLVFPKGAHGKTVQIIYASNGEDLDENIRVDDAIGGLLLNSLVQFYGQPVPIKKTEDIQND